MQRIKLPYGISNFKSLREQNYIYIDKTSYIAILESLGGKYLFYTRPRRFGKSLFLSVLEHYYGLEHENKFTALFAGLHIGQHPTVIRNSYFVLKLNFSGLNTEDQWALESSFRLAFKDALITFFNKYSDFFAEAAMYKETIHHKEDFRSLWSLLFEAVRDSGYKIYLIIDEYDHFANDIIAMGDGAFYKQIVRAAGFVRDFYEAIKIGTETVIDRIFMTGVSPIMLDDLTSGFNISTNLTMSVTLNEMLGFTEKEVKTLMDQIGMDSAEETTIQDLRKNYNGYLFNKDGQAKVYNPDMILYFLTQWQMSGHYPEQLMDENVKTDYGRLQRLIANDHNRQMLNEIIQNEEVAADIINKFSFDQMYDDHNFVSLLFYMGLLTIDRQEKMRLVLKIPNYVIKTVFWEYIEKRLRSEYEIRLNTEELRLTIEQMAFEGTIKPYIKYIAENVLKSLSNRDLAQFNEKYIKVILFTYLIGSKAYRPYSEREIENGYIDIYLEKDLRIQGIQYEWILELKYVKKSDSALLAKVTEDGLMQLANYAASRELAGKPGVKQALIIFIGKDEHVVIES